MLAPHISVVNLGCRVNRVESDRITADLMRLGFAIVEPQDADLIVINTCAVTGEAEAKTRKAVRHALAHPNEPYVLVTGCVVNLHPEELLELSDRVIAEPSKIDVAERVCEVLGVESDSVPACSDGDVVDALGRSRLGVKIQDGCNHRCTYCIVWKARGPERSVPVESVLEQVREAQEAGVPEVVLTGVNLGAYDGKSATDEHVEIDELLEAIGRKRGAMMSGGRVNLQKTAEIVMTDFRTATLGRITLETPEQFERWLAAGLAKDAERAAKKEARLKSRGKGSGKREPGSGDPQAQ